MCEKPGAVNFKQGEKVIQAVKDAGVFYKEGFMYRCHPQIPALLEILKNKTIGDITKIKSSFGFDMTKVIPEHRLFNKDLAGGAILDVGLYPISFSRMIAGMQSGKKFINPIKLSAEAQIGETGVDEISSAIMQFDNGIIAEANTAIMKNMDNNAIIEGSNGKIIIDNPWMPGRDGGPYHSIIRIIKNGHEKRLENLKVLNIYSFLKLNFLVNQYLKEKQQVPHPGMTWEDTLSNLKVLDLWRQKINYKIKRRLNMQYDKIKGLDKNISKLIIGNDNQTHYDEAAKLWDHWIDVGGNAFDNAHIYGGGSMETLLGKWHKSRNNLNNLSNNSERSAYTKL